MKGKPVVKRFPLRGGRLASRLGVVLGSFYQPYKVGYGQRDFLVFEAKQDFAFGGVHFRVEAVRQFPVGLGSASHWRQQGRQHQQNMLKLDRFVHDENIDNASRSNNNPKFPGKIGASPPRAGFRA